METVHQKSKTGENHELLQIKKFEERFLINFCVGLFLIKGTDPLSTAW